MRTRQRRQGLILLVVLGMLSLFSLLAVTYVVFSGTSRSASLQMARRDYRGTPPDRLLDQAVRQVIRGTTDPDSVLWRHSLLEDLYGSIDAPLTAVARTSSFDVTGRTYGGGYTPPTFPTPVGNVMGPQLYDSMFLKIPLEWNNTLPLHHDALTGRVLTFTSGPLSNQSFRILRSIGQLELAQLPVFESVQFTVMIELSSVRDLLVTVGTTTRTVHDWIAAEANGAALLYSNYQSGNLTGPYTMLINDGAQNSPGLGLTVDVSGNITPTPTPSFVIGNTSPLVAPFNNVADSILANHSFTHKITRFGQPYNLAGDTDEAYDAADYNNFFLALRKAAATTSDDVIPSFHRPEVINFLASLDSNNLSLASMTPDQMQSFLNLVQRATGRPVSFVLKNFPQPGNTFQLNSQFTGGNGIDMTAGLRNPQLILDWDNHTDPVEQENFDAWLRWMLRGPWDVDNDFDGVKDSVWADLNFPLSTAPDGKLLKILAAFYIEDLGGRLDINAAGSQVQGLASYPLQLNNLKYAYLPGGGAAPADWPQGLGFGPADIYMRHLFDTDVAFQNVMARRYAAENGSNKPGVDNVDDAVSALIAHQSTALPNTSTRPQFPRNARLPGLPVSTHGRLGVALDLLGNPILMDNLAATLSETVDDPYDAYVLNDGHMDRHLNISEWERVLRYNDPDRSSLPRDLERLAAGALSPANGQFLERVRSITPRSVSLSTPRFTKVLATGSSLRRVSSFVEFVESYMQRRFTGGTYPRINNTQMAQLFPVEFAQNRPLDLNRPLGNGYDDNGDGQVDEPQELVVNAAGVLVGQPEPWVTGPLVNGNYWRGSTEFDPGFDPLSTTPSVLTPAQFSPFSGNRSRQLLARHLYCLAQLILPVDNANNNLYIFPNQPTSAPVDNETRARILAQWAVNVVDYRDADVAMTRFAYDPDPFRDTSGNYAPAWQPDNQHVVFGFEQPELLITETLALHDIRARQRTNSQDWDQLRLPQGSLFLEFFCPRSTAITQAEDNLLPGLSPSLYGRPNTASPFTLDLGRAVSDGANVYPVWRVLLTKPESTSTGPSKDGFFRAYDDDDTDPTPVPPSSPTHPTVTTGLSSFNYTYQIGNADAGLRWRSVTPATDLQSTDTTPIPEPTIDRVLWFADIAPTPANAALPPAITDPETRIYSFREGRNVVEGGQYLVVGPRAITYLGSKRQTAPLNHTPNNHRISLRWEDPNNAGTYRWDWVQVWNQDNVPGFWIPGSPPKSTSPLPPPIPLGNMIRPCATMVAGAPLPTDWGATLPPEITQTYIGLNISEPNPSPGEYYPIPTVRVNDTDNTGDPDIDAPGYRTLSMDGYLDASVSPPSGVMSVFDADNSSSGPHAYFLQENGWQNNGRHPRPGTARNWSAAVLQRLADPDLPWHPALNPYITVDWQSIDLTVFSGEDNPINEDDYYLATRSRSGRPTKVVERAGGGTFERHLGNPGTTFFSYETSFLQTQSTPVTSTTSNYFDRELLSEHVTGDTYPYSTPERLRGNTATFATLGYLNRSYIIRNTETTEYIDNNYFGAPSPTPLAPHHPNRNFINSLELANVTLSAPGTFHQDFYFEPQIGTAIPPRNRHTLDLESRLGNAPKVAGELLEVTGVGSPWPDSWQVVNPTITSARTPSNNALASRNALLGAYEAPLNFIPTFREPGRVNVNTATEDSVWRGVMGNMMPPATRNAGGAIPFAPALRSNMVVAPGPSVLDSRGVGGNPNFNSTFPTLMPGVFTSITGRRAFPFATPFANNASDMTLFRQVVSPNPAFRIMDPSNLPALANSGVPIDNSFVHNYPAVRTQNLLTSQSHVFAVRVTLGFFEYTPGLGIGVEYGSEQGRSVRHRAFYVIDRSIPVGFRPGEDLNTDQTIVARRIVE